jgi:4-hydroxybenzoate polyprenyltransferase
MKRGQCFLKTFEAVVPYLEDESRPFYYHVITFLAAVTLRNFFEFLVSASSIRVLWHHPVHFTLFYASVALWMMLLLRLFTGEAVPRIARSVMVAFCVTPMVPVVDLLMQPLSSYKIQYQYLVPERIKDIWPVFFTFLGRYDGVTPAMRLEILAVCIAAGMYIFLKKRSFLRAIAGGVAAYLMIFWLFGAILYWITALERRAGLPYDTTPRTMIDVYVALALAAFLALAHACAPRDVTEIVKDGRFTRIAHYEMMVVGGLLIGYPWRAGLFNGLASFLELLFVFASMAFACLFSAITNNMEDVRIDSVSSPRRPSVSGAIPKNRYSQIAWTSLLLCVATGAAAGYLQLFLVCCFVGGYAIYSLPPVRMKRLPFLSKGVIAVNSLAALLCGYGFAGREINTLAPGFVLFFLAAFTACANFIDIKDLAGDKAAGIKTLPVLMGPRWSKLLIGSFFLITYSMFPLLFGMEAILVYSILLGLLLFVAINRRSYSEIPVFAIYLLSLALLLCYLLMGHMTSLDEVKPMVQSVSGQS